MTSQDLVLSFGDAEISLGVISVQIAPAGPDDAGVSSAETVVDTAILAAAAIDYRSEVRIFSVVGGEYEQRFTGLVDSVVPDGDETRINLITSLQLLQESRVGGLGIGKGTNALEATWSLLRAWGIDADKINIEGFTPGPVGMFEVAVALDGIELDEPVTIGGVQLLPRGLVSRLADGLGSEELWKLYADASTWALVLPTASTLIDAEIEGLKAIDVALALITARAQYSASQLPGGQPRTFHRQWTMTRVLRRNVVLVKRSATGGRWLRSLIDLSDRVSLTLDQIEVRTDNSGDWSIQSVTMQEALLAWRRASDSPDPLSAVVALWEAIEFYASGVKTTKIFQTAEIESIRKAAASGLDLEKAQRVTEILGRINEPPLMARLKVALNEDGVPYADHELRLLQRVRKARNDLMHGRSRLPPSHADLRYAIAIVNRMLIYRLNTLTKQSLESSLLLPIVQEQRG